MRFLSPYRVLDLTNERGLLAGKMSANPGADVIQVEPIGGSSVRQIGPFVKEGHEGRFGAERSVLYENVHEDLQYRWRYSRHERHRQTQVAGRRRSPRRPGDLV